jgi:hypothetical protein
MTRQFRTRPHQTHFSFDDIPKLGKLVQLVAAQENAHGSDSRVSYHRDVRTAHLGNPHRSELVQREFHPTPAHPALSEQNRPRRCQTNEDSQHEQKWSQDDERAGGHHAVNAPACFRSDPKIGIRLECRALSRRIYRRRWLPLASASLGWWLSGNPPMAIPDVVGKILSRRR